MCVRVCVCCLLHGFLLGLFFYCLPKYALSNGLENKRCAMLKPAFCSFFYWKDRRRVPVLLASPAVAGNPWLRRVLLWGRGLLRFACVMAMR